MKIFRHHLKYIKYFKYKDFSGGIYFECLRNSMIFKQLIKHIYRISEDFRSIKIAGDNEYPFLLKGTFWVPT